MSNYKPIPKNFSACWIRDSHPALKGYTDTECKIHYVLYSTPENMSGLPADFDINSYRFIWDDVKELNDKEIISHFFNFGIPEQRVYSIPLDFDCNAYKEYNPDLANFSDRDLKIHYLKYGIREGRCYKLELPEDFSLEGYRTYNPDIAEHNDIWLKQHYTTYGKAENRAYKISLPLDFDWKEYLFFNKDLKELSSKQLEAHYYMTGKNEGRKYKDPFFDKEFFRKHNKNQKAEYEESISNIKLIKSKHLLEKIESLSNYKQNCVLLVGHMATVQGASHYLYSLYSYLKTLTDQTIYIVDANPNDKLLQKYQVQKENFISYEQDSTLLYYICTKLKPQSIYFNCLNSQMIDVYEELKGKNIIIHSHEIKEDYVKFGKNIIPDYVVSERIKEQYSSDYNIKPFVQTEVLTPHVIESIENNKQRILSKDEKKGIKKNKITIGMSGNTIKRKNYDLFAQLAEEFPDYNFVWIGGSGSLTTNTVPNLLHIKEVSLPFAYYNLLDYFILTSTTDPCPYVVLENLYLGNKVITFKDNIYTDHKCQMLKDVYYEYDGEISLENAREAIAIFVKKEEAKQKHTIGKIYIKQKHSVIDERLIFELLLPKDFSAKGYKKYNSNIKYSSEEQISWAYIRNGTKQNHIYNLELLPNDFQAEQYRFFNLDLQEYSDAELEMHYCNFGINESRRYKDEFFDKKYLDYTYNTKNLPYEDYAKDVTKIKSSKLGSIIEKIPAINCDILLIEHAQDLNGASHHLGLLYNVLTKENNLNVYIATPRLNEEKLDKYDIPKTKVIEYLNDCTLLWNICTRLESKKIYFNSMNFEMSFVAGLLDKQKVILHAHEIKEHYQSPKYINKLVPTFNISKEDILKYGSDVNIAHQTGIIDISFFDKAETFSYVETAEIFNHKGGLNSKKNTIGMSGILCDRKNYKMFVEVAKSLPQFNFLWIGGKEDITEDRVDNIFHVKETQWPFNAYTNIDYFALFSSIEPMGYVILENLYLGNSVIAFKDSMITKFSNKGIEDLFVILNGSITKEKMIDILPKMCSKRPAKQPDKGKSYVKKLSKLNNKFIESFIC